MIETKNLNFKDIVRYPDLKIDPSSVTFITGQSGSGKSTLLKLINNTHNVSKDTIYIDGKDLLELDPIELRKDFILASQLLYLINGTIRENYALYYTYRHQEVPSDADIEKYLQIVCADFKPDDRVDTMSGGEKQRVFLSIFISLARYVLMLDEPTSALDTDTATLAMQNTISYCRDHGIGVIMVTHNNDLVHLADRVIELNASKGRENI